MRKKAVENKDSIMPFKSRWAFKTNAVEWLVLLPNVTAEFDLFGSPYKHYTLSLGIKGNWNTSQNYKPSIVLYIIWLMPVWSSGNISVLLNVTSIIWILLLSFNG